MNRTAYRISFEFFPPKTAEGTEKLFESARALSVFNPAFYSVTFGAGGSTRQRTVETVMALQKLTPVPVAPHVSCLGFDRHELLHLLEQYAQLEVKRLIVLRGDLPQGMVATSEYELACDFVRFIREATGDRFLLEVAAYPECHPQALSAQHDLLNLKKKMEAGANTAITQYFYNADAYFYFRDDCEKQGITLPLVPGIMPILHLGNLMRFSENCGAEIPRWLVKRLQSYGDDIESVRAFGIEVVSQLCDKLLQGGVPGLHFYTLNAHEVTTAVIANL